MAHHLTAIYGNRYFGLLHGEDQSQHHHIIVSNVFVGSQEYHLTPEGRGQVRSSCEFALGEIQDPLFLYSDFVRTCETKDEALKVLPGEALCEVKLRERNYGSLEGKNRSQLSRVWSSDLRDESHKDYDVESLIEMSTRLGFLLWGTESNYQGRDIVLVSHPDVLSVFDCMVHSDQIRLHRNYAFAPGELRKLGSRDLSKRYQSHGTK